MFKIEKNIPLPTRRWGIKLYPYSDLKVGDSFFVPELDPDERRRLAAVIRNGFWRHRPKKFTAAIQHDGIRAWRIE